MKKWALRIAVSLKVLAAPPVAQFVGPSVQGDRPSHDRVEAPWLIDGPINGQTFRQIHQRGLHPTCDHATSSSWIIFDAAGATPFVRLSELPGPLLAQVLA
jgi:hypothetical protein